MINREHGGSAGLGRFGGFQMNGTGRFSGAALHKTLSDRSLRLNCGSTGGCPPSLAVCSRLPASGPFLSNLPYWAVLQLLFRPHSRGTNHMQRNPGHHAPESANWVTPIHPPC